MNNAKFEAPTVQFAEELLSYLPSRPDYDTWIRTISALANTFDHSTATALCLNRFGDEKRDETARKISQRLTNVTFATLVYIAKEHGYRPTNSPQSPIYSTQKRSFATPKIDKVKFTDPPNLIFGFPPNDQLPDFVADVIYIDIAKGKDHKQARKEALQNAYWLRSERAYRVAINKKVINKNLDPQTQEPQRDFTNLTFGFANAKLTLHNLASAIGKGYAVTACELLSENGIIRRATASFRHSDCFMIDIDNAEADKTKSKDYLSIDDCLAMPTTAQAIMLYTSPSHTENWHRYRLVFPFPRLLSNPEHIKKVVNHYLNLYPQADPKCTDPARAFYGNSNATIYIIPTGEVLQFKNGVQI